MEKKGLFPLLKRLFSTDVIIRNVGGKQMKVFDINQAQQSGRIKTNALVDRFNRVFTTNNTSLYGQQASINYQTLRPQLYSEYDAMDTDAIISSALDIIADESTLKNDMGEVLSIKSPDEDIQNILDNLFYDVLNIEFNLWPWIRNLCKYGDFFLKLEIAEGLGVYNVIPYTAFHISRIENSNPDNPMEIKFLFSPEGIIQPMYGSGVDLDNGRNIVFDNYEISHFRLLADLNFLPYGRSYIEPARKLYKQYTLMEDAMLIHRIVRAPEKRIFYMNVGSIPSNEVDAFMEKTLNKLKRAPHQDPSTGDYDLRFNLQNLLEDFYIPIRGNDTTTKIDSLNGLQWDGIEDVEYLRDKLFAALKVPKAFMGYDEHTEGKATLAAQDIRFARTIERIQRIVTSELYKIALVHLYSQGIRDSQLSNFELSLTNPSIIYDQERIALLQEKVNLAKDVIENQLLPSDWVYENIFNFSEDQFDEYRDQIVEDSKRVFRNRQIQDEGNDPKATGVSYGTPHDLASLYGRGEPSQQLPQGYDENKPKEKLGRPKSNVTNRNTQEDNFGKDRLGVKGMKLDYNDNGRINPNSKSKSSPTLESKNQILKHMNVLKSMNSPNKKQIIFEGENEGKSFLDESNIID